MSRRSGGTFLNLGGSLMSRTCQLTSKKPLKGNHVSHSNSKTNRFFYPNLQTKRIYVPEIQKWVTVKLAAKALRTINKMGAYKFFKTQVEKGHDPLVWSQDKDYKHAIGQTGYRRIEVEKNGQKSFAITYEAEGIQKRRVKLSSLLK